MKDKKTTVVIGMLSVFSTRLRVLRDGGADYIEITVQQVLNLSIPKNVRGSQIQRKLNPESRDGQNPEKYFTRSAT